MQRCVAVVIHRAVRRWKKKENMAVLGFGFCLENMFNLAMGISAFINLPWFISAYLINAEGVDIKQKHIPYKYCFVCNWPRVSCFVSLSHLTCIIF